MYSLDGYPEDQIANLAKDAITERSNIDNLDSFMLDLNGTIATKEKSLNKYYLFRSIATKEYRKHCIELMPEKSVIDIILLSKDTRRFYRNGRRQSEPRYRVQKIQFDEGEGNLNKMTPLSPPTDFKQSEKENAFQLAKNLAAPDNLKIHIQGFPDNFPLPSGILPSMLSPLEYYIPIETRY